MEATMDVTLPPEDALLGRTIAEHRGRMLAGGWLIYVGAVLVLAALMQLPQVLARDGSAGMDPLIGVPLAFVSGAAMLFISYRRWQQAVTVFEKGFVWSQGGQSRRIRWDEIAGATHRTERSRAGIARELEVELSNGEHIVLTDALEGLDQLTSYVRSMAGGRDG
jgi:hypothetical protein